MRPHPAIAVALLALLAAPTIPAGGEPDVLEDDVALAGSLSGSGGGRDFTLEVPAGADVLWVRLWAEPTASDFDLFVRRGAPATRTAFDWRGNGAEADEAVKVLAPVAGTYHVRVESYAGAGPFTLHATYRVIEAARTWVAGSDTTPNWAYDATRRGEAIASARAGHLNTIFVDGKDAAGRVAWTSSAYPEAFAAAAPGDSPIERMVRDANAGSPRLAVAVRFATFHDPHAASVMPQARIEGTSWLDPACPATRAFMGQQILDLLANTAVDEVNLDFVRFPASSQVSATASLPCTGGTWASPAQPKTRVVADAVAEIRAAVKQRFPGVVLSGDLFGYSCYAPVTSVGHDAFLLAPLLDHVMPMLYPTSFSSTAGADPYGTVRAATEACIHQTLSREKVKPWVQGYDSGGYDYNTPGQVATQVRAVRDAGGSGAVVWWFVSMGTDPAVWAPLASAMPPDWQARVHRDRVWLREGFEAPGGWRDQGLGGPDAWGATAKRAVEGLGSLHAGPAEGGYGDLVHEDAVVGPFDLGDADEPTLVFRHWVQGAEGCLLPACALGLASSDHGRVQASADGRLTWVTLRDDLLASAGWRTEEASLAAFAGEADVTLRFTWSSDADPARGDGWYVDGVEVLDLGG